MGTVGRQAFRVGHSIAVLIFVFILGRVAVTGRDWLLKERHQQRSPVVDAIAGKTAGAANANLLHFRPLFSAKVAIQVAHERSPSIVVVPVGEQVEVPLVDVAGVVAPVAGPVVAHICSSRLPAFDVGQHSQRLGGRFSGKFDREGERSHATTGPPAVDALEEFAVDVARTAVVGNVGDDVSKTVDLIR